MFRDNIENDRIIENVHRKGKFSLEKGIISAWQILFENSFFRFSDLLESACVDSVDSGKMTKDLAACVHGLANVKENMYLNTDDFILAVKENFEKKLNS